MGQAQKVDAVTKKQKTAITPTREEDFSQWYQNVIKAADMAENAPVRGCMIIKPYGYAVWENIQRIFDGMIKDLGVQNAYFPLLIPLSFMSKEAEHVEGFAKECAVVTHHRLEQGDNGLVPAGLLEEPFVIRPTSETIIGDAMSRWVQSYRDLPLKLNQWCNVMRWEMRPRLFLRTSEFLWQEGHNCFATAQEAQEDAYKMLETYADFIENYLAIPVIQGEKTADERFPGAVATFTVEAMMQDGKALQSGTTHNLGQNFSKSSGISFQGQDGQEHFAYTTSWGISTRLIGGMIMVHGDDDGMVMPPRVAPYHVSIIPVVRDDAQRKTVISHCKNLENRLKEQGIRVHLDCSDERTPNKMWRAIKKGIPVRVEIGAREIEENALTYVRRDIGRDSKASCTPDEFVELLPSVLDSIQDDMLDRARKFLNEHILDVDTLDEIREFFVAGKKGFVRTNKSVLDDPNFENIKKEFSLTPRCIPLLNREKIVIGKSY